MKEGISNIKSSWDDLKFAQRTNNIHKVQTEEHKKLLQQDSSKNQSTCKSKTLLKKMTSLKKWNVNPDFNSQKPYRKLSVWFTLPPYHTFLKWTWKSQIALIGKMIHVLVEHLEVNQWKNSSTVIEWFKTIDK